MPIFQISAADWRITIRRGNLQGQFSHRSHTCYASSKTPEIGGQMLRPKRRPPGGIQHRGSLKTYLTTSMVAVVCPLFLPFSAVAHLPTPTTGWNLGNTLEPRSAATEGMHITMRRASRAFASPVWVGPGRLPTSGRRAHPTSLATCRAISPLSRRQLLSRPLQTGVISFPDKTFLCECGSITLRT